LLVNLFAGIAISSIILTIVMSLRSGYKPAIFFAIAWVSLLTTISIFVAENLTVIDGNVYTHFCQVVGASLEAVLFTDIRDFTALSEKVGTEATFVFLNKYLEIMEPIIMSHCGFIDKFIGDAIMALFSDPESAVLAAMEMANSTQNLPLEDGSVLQTGFGIHYGELILGTVGSENRLDTTVIGDTVNLASRIESLSKECAARILVSSERILSYVRICEYSFYRKFNTYYTIASCQQIRFFK